MSFSLNALFSVVGISRQAVHQYQKRQMVFDDKMIVLIKEAEFLRKEHPGCGVDKMYHALKPDFIGRDRFIEVFMSIGFRLKRKKNYSKTTVRGSFYYPNLIEGVLINGSSQIWQSDITYVKVGGTFYYIVFIIDVYTKKIVGFNVSVNLRAQANMKALRMALKDNAPPWIHHSDRGSQYIYKPYIKELNKYGIKISMGETAMDNAYAERINGTIKNEYLHYWQPQNFKQLKRQVLKAVNNYNNKRPHNHIKKKTPQEFENDLLNLELHDRPMAIIYTNGHLKMKVTSSHLSFYAQQNLQTPVCPILK